MLLPITVSLGLLALIAGFGGLIGGISGAIEQYKELGIGIVFAQFGWILIVIFMFIVPAIGFVLLWSLLVRGPLATSRDRAFYLATVIIGLYSTGYAGWLIASSPEIPSTWIGFGPPFFIGLLNIVGLLLQLRWRFARIQLNCHLD